ncbi:MAG: hypothetical protein HY319_14865 [Armatimonadetes bacterium]|nr:hypothetical protein [Armatimonadota bacterium]
MSSLRWTLEASEALEPLSESERIALFTNLELLEQFPAMYPVRQRGRYVGLRYFVLKKRWLVYYRLLDSGLILVFSIVAARVQPQ